MTYNRIHLPSKITPYGLPGSNEIKYMYDAAGNKLQKYVKMDDCDPATQLPCNGITETTFDYIGNFVYENGELKMIYHPEGVIRPTPPSAENDTEFVFDYFIKDYLGNVRVVMTEEDATYTDKFLATLEDVHSYIEEQNFENLEEVREDLPTGYPVNGSVSLNERIALLNAANGTEIGPSIVLPVKQGEKVSLSTEYFYTEDAAGATYDNIDFLINEVLIAFAAGGSGILPLNETQLIDIASGQGNYSNALANLFNNEIDTTDMSRPYAYMVWTAYDANLNIIPGASGIERVSDPNDLEVLIREEIAISADGFLHAYVSNGSTVGVNFDNFQVTTMRGKVRQINHYYPYGLTISGIGTNSDEYLNKYTTKELQTGEWNPALSNGLEMYDFHARHYDPQLGRWFAPDPAEQFSNPYLAMGNNPVMYVDPDGEFIVPMLIGAGVSVITNGINNSINGQDFFENAGKAALIGGISGAFSFGVGQAVMGMGTFGKIAVQTVAHGHLGGMATSISGGDYYSGFASGAAGSLVAGGAGLATNGVESNLLRGTAVIGGGAIAGGLGAKITGGDFWDGARNGAISSGLNHGIHEGLFGEGLMMASITGRARHLVAPDAKAVGLTGEVSYGASASIEKAKLLILRGPDRGLHSMTDMGYGMLSDIQISGGIETSNYYYTGSANNLSYSTFQGVRGEANLNFSMLPFASGGLTGSIAPVDNGFNRMYSIGSTFTLGQSAFDWLLVPYTGGWNIGESW